MLRKLIDKLIHSVGHSKYERHRGSSGGYHKRPQYGRSSSSRHSYGSGRGHGYYKNRYGSSS
ncbi:hypothetical protein G5B47_04560 [Paenibacillus sp. 7124]|uniref:Uncharacterized protein n=2 Tax=Paenibacillus TaxID=44249 RepID=A0A6M1PGR8_9BACL|nr:MULTISPECIES: hypothetical protein [Paenibacillus]AHV98289.1 hypothetical protein PSAB_16935 [Paenibacillus sabinae T27]NGM81682.1 hypothetical protein [Paenibacillus apii]NJJ41516.1 hypothetical protein [Paenibacillus apii]